MAPVITAEGLGRRFGDTWALDGLTLDAEPGEVIALLGPNGAGKTTTVRLLDGVLTPDRGSARVLGLDPVTQGTEVRRRTGVLTEAGGLDDRLTLTENIVTHARIRGIPMIEARQRAATLLARFGMADQAERQAQGLSTGERKRVALARALLHRPEVLFLDEPTSGLDPAATRDVLDLIGTLAADEGATVVLCTHFLVEAARLCRRVAIIEKGKLLAFGGPTELAARLWTGLRVEIELGLPADGTLMAGLAAMADVRDVQPTPAGVSAVVPDRSAIPAVVAALVTNETPVYGVVPRPPTLEDVYFALTGRTGAEL
ncbi:MAG: ATP-binding cassette domain-containing protein [Acidimicrobiales bacterium]